MPELISTRAYTVAKESFFAISVDVQKSLNIKTLGILSLRKRNVGNVNLLENHSNLIYTISHLWIKKTQPLE